MRFQKDVAKDGDVTAFTIGQEVMNTDAIASDVQNDTVNTPTTVPDIRRNALKSSEDTRGQSPIVSTIRTLPVTE